MNRKPILSPIQNLQREQNEKLLMLKIMSDLMAVHNTFLDKYDELKVLVQAPLKKGDKGDRGPAGINAHMKGDRGNDGHSPTKEELLSLIVPLIPEVKDKKIILSEEHIDKIADRASKKVKLPKVNEIDPLSIIDQIMKLPEGKRLSTRHIDGLEQTMHAFRTQLNKGYLHGGGISSLLAGTGIVITKNSDGSYTIAATGGTGGVNVETPVGIVNGVNTIFTFINIPKAIVVDQGRTMIQNQGWSLAGLAATLDLAPNTEIFSIY